MTILSSMTGSIIFKNIIFRCFSSCESFLIANCALIILTWMYIKFLKSDISIVELLISSTKLVSSIIFINLCILKLLFPGWQGKTPNHYTHSWLLSYFTINPLPFLTCIIFKINPESHHITLWTLLLSYYMLPAIVA